MTAIWGAHRVAIIGDCLGQEIVSVFNVTGHDTALQAATSVGTAYATAFKPALASDYNFGTAYAVDMRVANGETASYDLGVHETGGDGQVGEIGISALIRWTDSSSGRATRSGRTFLGPLASNEYAKGGLTLSTTYRVTLQGLVDDFVEQFQGTTALVVVHGAHTATPELGVITAGTVLTNTGHLDTRRR